MTWISFGALACRGKIWC